MAAAAPISKRWLFGPIPDLLLGCGALYVLLFAVFAAGGNTFLSLTPAWLAPVCVLLVSMPHYGATLVRVYEHRNDRRAYALFSVWITLALVVAFLAGAWHAGFASLLLTVYLTWSPWHYTGQNYGVAVLFLRRAGVALDGAPKRWLYASFVLSYVLTFCVIHESWTWAGARALPDAAGLPPEAGFALRFVPIGIPAASLVVPLVASGWAISTLVALALLLRRAAVSALLPVALLVLTQSLWFALPALALHWGVFAGVGPLDPASLGAFLVWIAVGHALQYLWVTTYYARAGKDYRGALPYFGKTLAAGALVWTLPVLLFAARPFDAPSYDAGIAFLVASVVNLHHFILDGAIWKLRSTRIARILIASQAAADEDDAPPRRASGGWMKQATWALAGVCLLIALLVFVHESWLLPRALAASDTRAVDDTLDRLAFAGRDSAPARAQLGDLLAAQKAWAAALAQYQRSVALQPGAAAQGQIAMMHARLGDVAASRDAQDRALALAPDNAQLVAWAALLSERLGDAERAAELRSRAAAMEPAATDGPAVARKAALY
jgi:tetratricopeptide (TPR) repeat protein